jgi:hypothetical protein
LAKTFRLVLHFRVRPLVYGTVRVLHPGKKCLSR